MDLRSSLWGSIELEILQFRPTYYAKTNRDQDWSSREKNSP